MNAMKTRKHLRFNRGFTVIELIVILAIVFLVAGFLLPSLIQAKHKAQRISCVSHLKQIGLAFRIFSGDNTNLFPMALSTNYGGTKELTASSDFFRHWQIMSNELGAALLVTCPSDTRREAVDLAIAGACNRCAWARPMRCSRAAAST